MIRILGLVALLVTSSTYASAQGMPTAIRDVITNNVIGEWGLTITYDGQVSKGTFTAKWVQGGKYAVLLTSSTVDPKGQETSQTGIAGWDDQTQTWREQSFNSDGETFRVAWSDFKANRWTGQGTGVFMGKPMSSVTTVEFSGDKLVYRDTSHGKPFLFEAVRR